MFARQRCVHRGSFREVAHVSSVVGFACSLHLSWPSHDHTVQICQAYGIQSPLENPRLSIRQQDGPFPARRQLSTSISFTTHNDEQTTKCVFSVCARRRKSRREKVRPRMSWPRVLLKHPHPHPSQHLCLTPRPQHSPPLRPRLRLQLKPQQHHLLHHF